MNEQAAAIHPPRAPRLGRVLRGIGAVLAGVLANIVIVGALDSALRAMGVFPPMFQPMAEHQWAIALICRLFFAVFGGFLTARLAPAWPMRHAVVLGCIETAMTVPFVLANWNKPEFGPHWFAISAAASCLPLAALGGVLGAKRTVRENQ